MKLSCGYEYNEWYIGLGLYYHAGLWSEPRGSKLLRFTLGPIHVGLYWGKPDFCKGG